MAYTQEDFQFLGHCPICKTKLTQCRASLLEKSKGSSTIYSECYRCGSSQLINIFRNAMGLITTLGMLTDLKKEDARRVKVLSPLTANDVIDVYEWFEKN